jgi:hypothetical protein
MYFSTKAQMYLENKISPIFNPLIHEGNFSETILGNLSAKLHGVICDKSLNFDMSKREKPKNSIRVLLCY